MGGFAQVENLGGNAGDNAVLGHLFHDGCTGAHRGAVVYPHIAHEGVRSDVADATDLPFAIDGHVGRDYREVSYLDGVAEHHVDIDHHMVSQLAANSEIRVATDHDPDSYLVHAGYRLYSTAGIDVGNLGNHDLDMGTQLLAHAIRHEARFPVLSANLVGCQRLTHLCHPAALLVVKGVSSEISPTIPILIPFLSMIT